MRKNLGLCIGIWLFYEISAKSLFAKCNMGRMGVGVCPGWFWDNMSQISRMLISSLLLSDTDKLHHKNMQTAVLSQLFENEITN